MRWLGYKFLFMCSDSGICCTCLLLAGSLASSFMNLCESYEPKLAKFKFVASIVVVGFAIDKTHQLTLIHSPTARVSSAITCGL